MAQTWERQSYSLARLAALGLQVIFRGVPSDAGGPDYQDAIVAGSDGRIRSGDIEFHVSASDWVRHGHDRDPRYDDVIVHVVWHKDLDETRTSRGRSIPILEVGREMNPAGVEVRQPSLTEHPCVAAFAALDSQELATAICQAGLDRFEQRAGIFEAEIESSEPSQVAYRAILASLGYASNRGCFEALADVAPYSWLCSIPRELWQEVLLDAAGLGAQARHQPPARMNPEQWRLVRIRPSNHPARRLVAASRFLVRIEADLPSTLIAWVEESSGAAALRRHLLVTCPDGSAIGPGRADEMAVSAILPFVAATEPGSETPRRLFSAYPSPPANRWTRLMTSMMRDAGHTVIVKRAIQHQGLHALYHSHCRYERRSGCPVCGAGLHASQRGIH